MNIAHRGASAYAPENTRASFHLGLRLGADGLETDLRFTRDGEVVLLHDERVDRTTDGHGPVAELSLAEVRALDAGSWFSPEFAGERILTLAEFLDEFGGRTHLALELKVDGLEPAVVAQIRERSLLETATATSFERERLLRLLALAPEVRTGYLTRTFTPGELTALAAEGIRQACPRASGVTAEVVREAHRLGLEVRAWGVKSERDMWQALEAGVDGMTINWPDWLRMARR